MENLDSPTGRFVISISAWEVRMSLWIETPLLHDRSRDRHLLVLEDPHWSLNSAVWISESIVMLKLRKYPGNHSPPEISATIDCIAGTAEVDGKRVDSLELVERALDEALVWHSPAPPNQGRGPKRRSLLRALFGGSR